MKTDFFEFKKFIVFQNNTAMKVGTDGVLLGACSDFENSKKILDIGSGTGLLSLMAAQKSNAEITAVEIDKNAYIQTFENFQNSIWKDRLVAINSNFLDFYKNCNTKFDFIVCNPPFFVNSLKPKQNSRYIARHNENLPFEELFSGVSKILSDSGKFSIIFPVDLEDYIFRHALRNKLYINKIINIKPNYLSIVKRTIIIFSKEKRIVERITISIETDKRHEYTQEYIDLTKDFYLKM